MKKDSSTKYKVFPGFTREGKFKELLTVFVAFDIGFGSGIDCKGTNNK
jgi:hypothetical protein